MHYSDVLGRFYQIHLKDEDKCRVNEHYSGAAHHHARMNECREELPARKFHEIRFMAHLRHLLAIVYRHGDFRYAKDDSLRGMDEKENWCPDRFVWPDPRMFDGIPADPRFIHGKSHPLDCGLQSLDAAIPVSDITQSGFVKIRGQAGQA